MAETRLVIVWRGDADASLGTVSNNHFLPSVGIGIKLEKSSSQKKEEKNSLKTNIFKIKTSQKFA